ncbi:MAG: glycosyltransferase [Halobacteria archaeon]
MKVSVVVPTYSMDRYPDFKECCDSVLAQTYDDIQLVIIVDGNDDVCEKARKDYGDRNDTKIFCSHDDAGPISRANMGSVVSDGDIVALTDDDAVPRIDWVEKLVETYERHDAVAVGGRIVPEWVAGYASYIPEEFYFLIGATHKGFRKDEGEVRNTFGANLSYDREAYLKLGGIKQGGLGPKKIQGRETEFCVRLEEEYGKGVIYNPEAVVSHKIYDFRKNPIWLVKRAFWQGYSKRGMEKLMPKTQDGEEVDFLGDLLNEFIPGRFDSMVEKKSPSEALQLLMLLILTFSVGLGYLWGALRWR